MHSGTTPPTGQPADGAGLLPLLKQLFVAHGHMVTADAQLEGKSGTVYAIPLLAESETGAVVIGTHEGPMPLDAATVEEFSATVADVAADHGVLCHSGPCDPDAWEAAAGIALWNRDQFARLLGESALAEALGETAPALPLDEAPQATEMVAENNGEIVYDAAAPRAPLDAQPEEALPDLSAFAAFAAAEEPAPSPTHNTPPAAYAPTPPATMPAYPPPQPRVAVPESPFGMLLAASAARPPSSLPASQPTPGAWNLPPAFAAPVASPPAAMPVAPPPSRSYARPLLPVRIRPEEAHKKVRDRLYSLSNVELILHPVHLFDYECDLLQEGKLSFDTADGRVQVHGSDKSALDVDPDAANPDAVGLLPPNHSHAITERVLRIAEDRALQLALAHVVKKHTRIADVRVPDENHSLFYTERRKVEPTADQVRLQPLGIFFRPVWRLHGDNGFVDVDAIDGRELDVQLIGSRSGAMMLE